MRAPLLLGVSMGLLACGNDPAPMPPPADVPALDAGPDGGGPDVSSPDVAAPDARADGGASACGNTFGPTCNLVTSAGCPAGQGCYFDPRATLPAARCRTAGRGGWGDPCTMPTDCREGFACLGSPARCLKLCCEGDNATCRDEARGGRAGARCAVPADLRGNNMPTVHVCLGDPCDPFATAGANRCPAETPRCEPLGDGATCFQQRAGCTPGGDGAPCCSNGCCQPGFTCVLSAAGMCPEAAPTGMCRRACNSRAAMPDAVCPTGQRCRVMFNMASGLPDYFRACSP